MDSKTDVSPENDRAGADTQSVEALRAQVDALSKALDQARARLAEPRPTGLLGGLMSARPPEGALGARARAARAAAETGDRTALMDYLRARREPAD